MKPPQVNPQKIISHSLIQEAANRKDSPFLVYSRVVPSELHLFQSEPAPWSEFSHHTSSPGECALWKLCSVKASSAALGAVALGLSREDTRAGVRLQLWASCYSHLLAQ